VAAISRCGAREKSCPLHADLSGAPAHPTRLPMIHGLCQEPPLAGELGGRPARRPPTARREGGTVHYPPPDPGTTKALDRLWEVLRHVLREGERLAVSS
jgi:hypothetical protein